MLNRYRCGSSSQSDGWRMIVLIAQTKGGVGKSTLAINLAIERSRAGRDVLLVDADEQGTAMDFTALRTEALGSPGYTAVSLAGPAVRTQVLQLQPKYEDIIIDAGGRDTTGLRAGLTVADVAIVGCPFTAGCVSAAPQNGRRLK